MFDMPVVRGPVNSVCRRTQHSVRTMSVSGIGEIYLSLQNRSFQIDLMEPAHFSAYSLAILIASSKY